MGCGAIFGIRLRSAKLVVWFDRSSCGSARRRRLERFSIELSSTVIASVSEAIQGHRLSPTISGLSSSLRSSQ